MPSGCGIRSCSSPERRAVSEPAAEGPPAILPLPKKEAEKRAPSGPEDEPISAREIKVQGLDKRTEIDLRALEDEGAVERKQYEHAQKKRWEGWLKEEIDRLEDKIRGTEKWKDGIMIYGNDGMGGSAGMGAIDFVVS